MRRDRILHLADMIDRLSPERFNMAFFVGKDGEELPGIAIELELDCGTAGCIAGWACATYRPDRPAHGHAAAAILELDAETARELFYPPRLSTRTPYEAAAVLRSLAKTGVVAWS